MVTSLVRVDEAFTDDEIIEWLRARIGEDLVDVIDEFETLTIVVTTDVWERAARLLKEEPRLAFTMFDSLFGVDAREDGFDVVAILYSVETGRRVLLRTRADGGREEPSVPTLTDVFVGADFHERETWDMFGIDFVGHLSLAPRILSVENFEGWPLRKDFHLATREAKPWPGVKEPAETDEDGNVIVKDVGIGEAVGPMPLDEIMAAQARAANPDLLEAEEDEAAEDAAADADDAPDELEARSEHPDLTAAGAAAGGTMVVEEASDSVDGVMAGISDPDEVRAAAASHRADRAREIAQEGLVTGTGGDGDEIPQGDPSAFEAHGRSPAMEAEGIDTRGKDEINVAAAKDSGEVDEEADVESGNEAATTSMEEGTPTDFQQESSRLGTPTVSDDDATEPPKISDDPVDRPVSGRPDDEHSEEPGGEAASGDQTANDAKRSEP